MVTVLDNTTMRGQQNIKIWRNVCKVAMHVSALESLHTEILHHVVRHTLYLGEFSSIIIKDIRLDTCLSEMSPLFILILVSFYFPLLASLQR